jgi:hypothetical protein
LCIVDGERCGELCQSNVHTMPVLVRVCHHVGYTAFSNEEPRPRGEWYGISSRLHAITIKISCQCGRYTYTYFLIGGGSDDQGICLFQSRLPLTVVNTYIDILPGVGQIRAVATLCLSARACEDDEETRKSTVRIGSCTVLPGCQGKISHISLRVQLSNE